MNLSERIENDFTYHAPTIINGEKHEHIREAAKLVAQLLVHLVPEGRELSIALTKLDETVFWANAGIARNGNVD